MELIRIEAVADLPDRVDKNRVGGVGFNFVAQGGDEAVHTAVGDKAVVAPDAVQDFIAGQGAALLFDEELQQPELLGG